MNMTAGRHAEDVAIDLAMRLTTEHPETVRRMVFQIEDLELLRAVSTLVDDADGDERLRGWLFMRTKVLEILQYADAVSAGASERIDRRTGRPRQRRPEGVQGVLLPPRPAPVVAPEPVAEVRPEPVVEPAPVEPVRPVIPIVPWTPLVDPRPALVVPLPRRDPPPFVYACLDLLPDVMWLLRTFWRAGESSVTIHQRALRASPDPEARRWARAWHATAWSPFAPPATALALLGVEARFSGRTLTLTDLDATAPAEAS